MRLWDPWVGNDPGPPGPMQATYQLFLMVNVNDAPPVTTSRIESLISRLSTLLVGQ